MITDVCVPISRLAQCILETKQDHEAASFPVALVGHAGDGNFHMVYLIDPSSERELAEARRLSDRTVERALAMDGTCTGEKAWRWPRKKRGIPEIRAWAGARRDGRDQEGTGSRESPESGKDPGGRVSCNENGMELPNLASHDGLSTTTPLRNRADTCP